jgi:hypothetical protein
MPFVLTGIDTDNDSVFIHGSEDVDMPMTPELQAACDAMPKTIQGVSHRGACTSR